MNTIKSFNGMSRGIFLAMLVLLIGVFTALYASELQVDTRFQPEMVRQGESSIYRLDIQIEGRGGHNIQEATPPRLPNVDGLRIQYIGPRQEFTIINNRSTIRLSFLYRVEALEAGTYLMPSYGFSLGQQTLTAPAVELEVVERRTPQLQEEDAPARTKPRLEVEFHRETMYTGEAVPASVRLYVSEEALLDARLGSPYPEKIGDSFAVGEYTQMRQRREIIEGERFSVGEWQVLLTPLKSGLEPLLFEMPMVVAYRGTSSDDPFRRMEEAFWGRSPFSSREQIQVYSEDMEVEVLPTPVGSMPEDFTGGIGVFRLSSVELDVRETRVGEPILYTVRIEGEGNFPRLRAPIAEGSENWRIYDPSESFESEDALGYKGVKSFTFTMIPRSDELEQTPKFHFSYFDPAAKAYEQITIPPQAIAVQPPPPGQVLPGVGERRRNPVEMRRGPDLLPPSPQMGSTVARIDLLPQVGLFVFLQVVFFITLVGLYLYQKNCYMIRNFSSYAKFYTSKKSVKRLIEKARISARQGEVREYLYHCYRALQYAFAPYAAGRAESLTLEDFHRLMDQNNLPGEYRDIVDAYFGATEKVQYAGKQGGAQEIQADLPKLEMLLYDILKRYRKGNLNALGGRRISSPVLWPGLLLLLALPLSGLALDEKEVFERGVDYYQNEQYDDALAEFLKLLPQLQSTALHYNLGNTYYRLGNFSSAILHFSKASYLEPRNADVQVNLALAREAAEVRAPSQSRLALVGQMFAPMYWWWLLSFSVLACLLAFLIFPLTRMKRIWVQFSRVISLVVLVVSVGGLWYWVGLSRMAIVVEPDAPLLIAPTATSPVDSRWMGGETVRMGKTHANYVYVRFPSEDRSGWTLRSSLRHIMDE